jgi:hypothetical protein
MASDLWNIFLGVVATFISTAIMWLWGNRGRWLASSANRVEPGDGDESRLEQPQSVRPASADRRLVNRQKADQFAYKFIFYLCSFGVLYLSITIAPLFKALFTQGDILLSDARVIGQYLPPLPIGKSYLQLTFFLMAALLYFPLLFVAQVLAGLVAPLVDAYREVNERIMTAITLSAFLLFCIPIAASSIWLFYPKSYGESLMTTLFFLAVPFVVSQAQSGRR